MGQTTSASAGKYAQLDLKARYCFFSTIYSGRIPVEPRIGQIQTRSML